MGNFEWAEVAKKAVEVLEENGGCLFPFVNLFFDD